MLHNIIRIWFEWVYHWGYLGVFILMVMESSLIPVPSELVMAPAAFWASQGKLNFGMVVLMGTLGGFVGSALSYLLGKTLGRGFVERYGRYFGCPPEKLSTAERMIQAYGHWGVFIARFIPVVRHLVSIPAGVLQMPFGKFSVMTIAGAGVWCFILSWFGSKVIGANPHLLDSPDQMIWALKDKFHWFALGALLLGALYAATILAFGKRAKQAAKE